MKALFEYLISTDNKDKVRIGLRDSLTPGDIIEILDFGYLMFFDYDSLKKMKYFNSMESWLKEYIKDKNGGLLYYADEAESAGYYDIQYFDRNLKNPSGKTIVTGIYRGNIPDSDFKKYTQDGLERLAKSRKKEKV